MLRRLVYFVVFAIVASMVIFYAVGYRWYHNAIVKTSIIAFVSRASDVQLFFDGQLVATALPFQISSVLPGMHTVRIEKPGSTIWEKTVTVDQNTVTRIDHVLLVPSPLSWRTLLDDAPTVVLNSAQDHMALFGGTSGVVSFLGVGDQTDTFLRSYNLSEGTIVRSGWIHNDLFLIVFADGTFQQFDLNENTVVTAPLPVKISSVIDDATFSDGIFVRSADGILEEIIFTDGKWNFKPVILPSWASIIDGFFVTPSFWYIQKGSAVWQIARSDSSIVRLLPIVADSSHKWRVWENVNGTATVLFDESAQSLIWIGTDDALHVLPLQGNVSEVSFTSSAFLFSVDGDVFVVDPSVSFEPVFVTRFSHNVSGLSWYDDPFHVLILQNNTLVLCERDGGNCTTLADTVEDFVVAADHYTIFAHTVKNAVQALTLSIEKRFLSF